MFNGVGGHNCVPDNKHWDPGQLDLATIAAKARAIVGGGTPAVAREQLSGHDGPGFEAEREEEGSLDRIGEQESVADQVRWIQSSLNRVLGTSLAVDGVLGPATRAAIMDFQRREGLAVDGIVGPITRAALERRLAGAPSAPPAPSAPGPSSGVRSFDGVPVARWLIPYLSWARDRGWQGRLNSGWRSPEHSERLCFDMCQNPTCPGKCAGRSSNHSADVKPGGAIDVSDEARFAELMAACPYSPRIFNNLSADRIHFSATGG